RDHRSTSLASSLLPRTLTEQRHNLTTNTLVSLAIVHTHLLGPTRPDSRPSKEPLPSHDTLITTLRHPQTQPAASHPPTPHPKTRSCIACAVLCFACAVLRRHFAHVKLC
ncbi:hypothetical protein HII31_13066, partial [Pseudocercospora fuligena]